MGHDACAPFGDTGFLSPGAGEALLVPLPLRPAPVDQHIRETQFLEISTRAECDAEKLYIFVLGRLALV